MKTLLIPLLICVLTNMPVATPNTKMNNETLHHGGAGSKGVETILDSSYSQSLELTKSGDVCDDRLCR